MQLKNIFIFLVIILISASAPAARLKDISHISGVRENQLVGYGLVVGLDGTGDKISQTPFTQQTFRNMLMQFGIRLPIDANLQLNNIAAVAISANLPPFAKIGQQIDVQVSSIGNATSLRAGALLLAPLVGADGKTYAMAQGSVIVSGFGAQGSDGSKVIVNSTASGRIPNGATVEKTLDTDFVQDGRLTFILNEPDFTTAIRIERAINKEFGLKLAHAMDATSVTVQLDHAPGLTQLYSNGTQSSARNYKGEAVAGGPTITNLYVPLVSRIENLLVDPGKQNARVIVNARTGTIVIGESVTISPVAVAHGNLSVVVSETPYVSQPNAFASGRTVKGKTSDININQAASRAFLLQGGASLGDLVNAVNAIGIAPGDLISILEAVKSAGALHADLDVI